jgi:hypothetical protein
MPYGTGKICLRKLLKGPIPGRSREKTAKPSKIKNFPSKFAERERVRS